MIKKPDVLSVADYIGEMGWVTSKDGLQYTWLKQAVTRQLDVCVKHYKPLIKELYEALLYTNEQLEKHIYKDADVTEFGGSKLSIQREIVKALAKVEGE